MIQAFKNNNYEIVNFEQIADIYIINTCTVTNMSDRKSRQILRQARKNNKNAVIVAVGCYAQVAKKELEKIPEIDLILGTNEKVDIVKLVTEFIFQKKQITIQDVMQDKDYKDFGCVTYTEKTRAVIKVQDGCDRFCTYCIIPYARGRVRSREPKSILEEIKSIASEGIKEVVITGIHVASYGKDFENEYRLIDLLEDINKIDGIQRIRLGSLEPLLITDEFINRLVKLDKICHHFHLSLQSGCTETLKRMGRRYNIEEFEEIVNKIRKVYKDVILTTDIIVGFPGETDEEFNKTYEFLKKIKFYKMHVFKYSQRNGTKAAIMKNQISGEKKDARSKKLLDLSDANENEYLDTYINKEIDVLFEEKEDEYYKGHTSNYILVESYKKKIENDIELVKIKKAEKHYIIA